MITSILFACLLAPSLRAERYGGQNDRSVGARGNAGRPVGQHSEIGPRPGQEHLAQWMNRHSSLPVPEQQRALEREPGFRELSPQVQQRMHDRLTKLSSLPPQQRQRVIDRTEAIEHLAPEQRQQVRGTMQQLSNLPQDRRRAVARAFRELRSMPPSKRQAALDSGRYASNFSPEEHSTLSNLVAVEPLLPPAPQPGVQPSQESQDPSTYSH